MKKNLNKFLIILIISLFLSCSAYAAGRAGLQSGDPNSVTVGTTSTQVLAPSLTREEITLINISDEVIYIAYGADAEIEKGLVLAPNNLGIASWEYPIIPYNVSINAICASGGKILTVHTGE